MTDPLLIMTVFTIGLAVLLLIVVEGAGLRKIVRNCDAGVKTEWRDEILSLEAAKRRLKEAKRTGEDDTAVESCRLAITQARKDVQTAREKFDEELNHHVSVLQDRRRKSLDKATENTTDFYRTELKTKWTSIGSPTVTTVMGVVGTALLLALVLIDIRYYNLFGFNVLPYLPDYPAPALLLGLVQVLLLLGLLLLLLVASVVIVPPLALLRLIRTVNDVRALAAKGIARFSLVACGRSTQCSKRALPLLDEISADSVSVFGDVHGRWTRRLIEATILFVRQYGSKLIPNRTVLIWISWTVVGLSFIVVCYIAVDFEPRYQLNAICEQPKGSRTVRVVLDPPLAGEASFTRIGSIGGNVFIVPEFCGYQRRIAVEKAESQPDGQRDSGGDRSEVEQEPRGRIEAEANSESNGEGRQWWPTTLMAGLKYVVDQIEGRRQFFDSLSGHDESQHFSATVTVVPLSRVLCMHEVHEGGSDGSAACEPPPQPDGTGLRIIVHETTENTTWTIVAPPDVQVRMDDEWRLKGEIAQRLCNGASAEISEPILFERGQTAPADEEAANGIIKAFLTRTYLEIDSV